MKNKFLIISLMSLFISCSNNSEQQESLQNQLSGTWLLISSVIKEGDSITKEDLAGQKMIKIINNSHFAFLRHDLNNGQDSTKDFVAGGGTCSYSENLYTENLEYCNYREWEGLSVEFIPTFRGDTLILTGREKLEDIEIDQVITETYVRID